MSARRILCSGSRALVGPTDINNSPVVLRGVCAQFSGGNYLRLRCVTVIHPTTDPN